jgi:hypothetical protein
MPIRPGIVVLIATCLISRPAQGASITCDRFAIVQSLSGTTLTVSLDTDLPDYTQVMASVSRSYREKGNPDEDYPLNYFEEKGTVGLWRKPRQIPVPDEVFKKALQERQRTTALAGIGFELGAVSPQIETSFTVPIFQANPVFGQNNKNLSGKAVTIKGTMRNVRAETRVSLPLGRAATPKTEFANATGLVAGRSYRLARATPLMPDDETLNPLVAMASRKAIPPNGRIKVLDVLKRHGGVWYRVEVPQLGVGLLNSDALIGQEVRVEPTR